MTPHDVCRIKSEVVQKRRAALGEKDVETRYAACVDQSWNSREARIKKGLNPTFSGCPACHNSVRDGETRDFIISEMDEFMDRVLNFKKEV